MPSFLLTNDDGIHAAGLAAARQVLEPLGRVVVVAPDRERSGAAHSLTLSRPLRIRQLTADSWMVEGTPTDCVNVALNRLLETPPDMVVSGINDGSNAGDDVTYSGTVCAALEGALLGSPALAVSIVHGGDPTRPWVGQLLRQVVGEALDRGLPARTLLNLNFPREQPLGLKLTSLGNGGFKAEIVEKTDPRGGKYYWIGGGRGRHRDHPPGTDLWALASGYASLTPIKLDLTCQQTLTRLRDWAVAGER